MSTLQIVETHSSQVQKAVCEYQLAKKNDRLLMVPFISVFEYLQLLKLVAESLSQIKRKAFFYLAAAVSDFYIPWSDISEHKIQSREGPLQLKLTQVPKMIPLLREFWAPEAFVVSFKLETDPELLLTKANLGLLRGNVHAVIANELESRKSTVSLVTREGVVQVDLGTFEEIEEPIVDVVVKKHQAYLE